LSEAAQTSAVIKKWRIWMNSIIYEHANVREKDSILDAILDAILDGTKKRSLPSKTITACHVMGQRKDRYLPKQLLLGKEDMVDRKNRFQFNFQRVRRR
jgi:hypothetical protein